MNAPGGHGDMCAPHGESGAVSDDRAGSARDDRAGSARDDRAGRIARRRGRREGKPDTRTEILRAAYRRFAEEGYERTSVRAVARQAGVDPALVRHYFPDKATLFLQAARIGYDPRALVRQIATGGRSGAGLRILRTSLPLWESPLGAGLVVVAVREPRLFRAFADLIGRAIARAAEEVLAELGAEERAVRVAMVESTTGGLFLTRYVLRIEPIASLPRSVVERRWAPLLQRILDGEV